MTSPTWYPDERALAGPEHLDSEAVAAYERKAGFDPSEDLALLRRLGLDDESTLVDLGAGTGALALAAAPHCRRVVAVDVSPAMISFSRTRAREKGLENVQFEQAGFLRYQHTGDPAAIVYSRNALHHLPDFWKAVALDRIRSFLRPGGFFRLRDLVVRAEPGEIANVIDAWLLSTPLSSHEGWTRRELETHLRTEGSTFSWLLEPMLERAGFEIVDARYSPARTFAAYVCRRRF